MSRLEVDVQDVRKKAQELADMGAKGDTLDFMIDYFGLDPNIKTKGKTRDGKINYEEMQKKFPSVELKGDESFDELLEIEKTGVHPREGKAVGGRIGYAYGRGLKLGSLLKKEGTTLKKAYRESMDDFIQYSGDAKYDADAILDDMLEKYGIDRDALDQYDVLDAYGKIYDDLQINRRESMYERAADEAMTEAGLPAPRKKEAYGGRIKYNEGSPKEKSTLDVIGDKFAKYSGIDSMIDLYNYLDKLGTSEMTADPFNKRKKLAKPVDLKKLRKSIEDKRENSKGGLSYIIGE